MPQVSRSTSGMKTVNVSALQSLIDTLRANMAAGKAITASDMNQLINAYNSWIQHTHTVADLLGIDTFGDVTTYGATGTWEPRSSGVVKNATASALIKAAQEAILAGDANEARNKINAIRTHTHQINDKDS